jgi:DNA-binding NtrC family response regulator
MPENPDVISIVIIDDTPSSLELLEETLCRSGLTIYTAVDPRRGLELVYEKRPQIVLTDLKMPQMSGLEVLDRVLEFDPLIDVVLMTAHYDTESAVDAIRRGAADYLNKPISIADFRARIARLIERARAQQRATDLEGQLLASSRFQNMVGRSPRMLDMFSRIRRISPHFRTVLITGPTGAGKDLVAHALHEMSPVSSGRFVVLNCSAVVETLFESELFGHTRGAFTGANSDKAGLIEHAHGGVLFLDEIGDMPMATQAKLLRAVQNQEVQRVGSLAIRKIDVRVIAATHHNLREAISEKRFREDLYYRLAMVEIETPRLADRMDDLPLLTRHFVDKYSAMYRKPIRGLTPRAQIVLARHDWPGNVRELENVIGNAAMMATTEFIDAWDLPAYVRSRHSDRTAGNQPSGAESDFGALEEQERRLVQEALHAASGNQSQAARTLRIGRDALRYKIKKYGLSETSGHTSSAPGTETAE